MKERLGIMDEIYNRIQSLDPRYFPSRKEYQAAVVAALHRDAVAFRESTARRVAGREYDLRSY